MVISASSPRLASLITAGVAAVVLVFSPWSIVSFVERIVDLASLMSTVTAPELEAVVNLARTAGRATAYGRRKPNFPYPTINSILSTPMPPFTTQGQYSFDAWVSRAGLQTNKHVLAH